MDDATTLSLGGITTPVQVRDTVDDPQMGEVPTTLMALADSLFADWTKGAAWSKDTFQDFSGSQLLQAIRLFTQKINFHRDQEDTPLLNPLELEEVVGRQAVSLPLPLQHLCRWTVLVRIGVRELRPDLLGLVTMAVMPPKGATKLSQPTETVGRTHYAVTHLMGNRFLCRGYCLNFNDDGDWILGGTENNRWVKDVWLTPGLVSIDTLVDMKRRKSLPSPNAKCSPSQERHLQRICNGHRTRLEKARKVAGLDSSNFSKAHGARLDLENKNIMQLILASVRALLAQAIVYKENRVLDSLAGQCGVTRATLLDDPTQVADAPAEVTHHLSRREAAFSHFRQCGSFVLPRGYMIFSAAKIPATIPVEVRTELTGVTGVAVGAAYLAARTDVPILRRSPAALPEIEDLTPLIDACGVPVLHGKIIENMDVITRDADGNEAEEGSQFMRFELEGTGAAEEMPLAPFLQKTSVRFLPMVIDFRRRRLRNDDMQGVHDGVHFAVSPDDVSRRFHPCRPNQQKSK